MQVALSDEVRKAFEDSTTYTFRKMIMVGLTLKFTPPNDAATYDYYGSIGFSGYIVGDCVLKLSELTAREAINRLAGETVEDAAVISDGVGELVNMIAGNAKALLQGGEISLSFPEVAQGGEKKLRPHPHSFLIELAYDSEIGDIAVGVAFSNSSILHNSQ